MPQQDWALVSEWERWVTAAAALAGGLLVGWVVNGVLRWLGRRARERTRAEYDELTIRAIRLPAAVACVLVGLYAASQAVVLGADAQSLIGRLLVACATALAIWLSMRLVNVGMSWFGHQSLADPRRTGLGLLHKLIAFAAWAVGLMLILGQLGYEIGPLLASLGVASLAVALALQETLSNLFAGVCVSLDRPIEIGDYVKLDSGEEGWVEAISWRATTLRTWARNLVVIPNSKLAQSVIENFRRPVRGLAVYVRGGVAYGSDLREAERIALEVARKVQESDPGGDPDYAPWLRYKTFGDSNVEFLMGLGCETYEDSFRIQHECVIGLYDAFNAAGIEISWPMRKLTGEVRLRGVPEELRPPGPRPDDA